ncbi:MAG TPA: DUF4249 family protein, partial [Niastella sp.]
MRSLLIITALTGTFLSCKKIITPDLNNAAPQIYIQGAVSDTAGPYYITILKTIGFYETDTYPGVPGASISITDSTAGITDQLIETAATGVYRTGTIMQGTPGHTYLLKVLLDGKTYTASSTMPQP